MVSELLPGPHRVPHRVSTHEGMHPHETSVAGHGAVASHGAHRGARSMSSTSDFGKEGLRGKHSSCPIFAVMRPHDMVNTGLGHDLGLPSY